MPKVSPLQGNFNGGEFSPLLHGRVENDRYKSGMAKCLRYIPTIQGGLTKCPGTKYVEEVKTSSKKTRIMDFEFSTEQAYVLELGDQYIRFYRNQASIQSGGGAYEIASPYLEADLFDLKFTQSADVITITNGSYAPRDLTRTDHDAWTLTEVEFTDGPYLPENDTDYTLAPAATTGTGIALLVGSIATINNCVDDGAGLIKCTTAAAHGLSTGDYVGIDGVVGTTEANGSWQVTVIDTTNFTLDGSTFTNAYTSGGAVRPKLFDSTDATDGRWVRIKHSSTWGWAKVASFVNYGSVTIDIESDFGATTASTEFRLGSWTSALGYPTASTYHEDRQVYLGAANTPQKIDMSNTGDYANFSTTAANGDVVASNAIAVTLNTAKINVARWAVSDEKGLLVGTVGGEWVLKGATETEALNPVNISAKKATSYGSADIQPVQVGKSTIFAQRTRKKIREMSYFYEVDGFRSPDLTILAEHITGTGIVEMAHTPEPQSIVWSVRDDGQLIGVTYERDIDGIRAGWHRHIMGGVSDAANTDAVVESIAVIPSQDTSTYELWMVVKRWIDGAEVRNIEFMMPIFDEQTDQQDAFFVDCGLTYDDPYDVSGITGADPGVITCTGHPLSDGDKFRVINLKGMGSLEGNTYKAENTTANTLEITNLEDVRTSILNATYKWTASGSGTDEYYLELAAGGDPGLTEYDYLQENNANMTPGTVGSLATGEWDWGDNDTLGYSTVYVRLSDGADPDDRPDGYVEGFDYDTVDTSGFDTYVSGGELRKLVTTISGLTHLEGETVSILADGAELPQQAVASGAITITEATTVQVGLPYNSDGQLLRLEAGAADGTALGKKRRSHRTGLLLHRSLGLKIGMDFNNLDEITFRTTSDPMTRAPALYSGILDHRLEADYDYENQIAWRSDSPLPSNILAIMPQLVTQDRG